MDVRRKIVGLVVAVLTVLVPFSHMACGRDACHPRNDSSSMPCHAMHSSESNVVLASKIDHSCCRLLPALPGVRCSLNVQKFEPQISSPVSEGPADYVAPEGLLKGLPSS